MSPNRQWALGCNDSDGKSHFGSRKSGNGRIVLVDLSSGVVVSQAHDVGRPCEAAVSDTGTYVVNDWGFAGEFSGTVLVRSKSGEQLYTRRFAANVHSVGISACGRYVVVQTCQAPNGPDGHLLEVHDVVSKEPLFSVKPATPWSSKYTFDIEEGSLANLWVHVDKLGRFAYDSSGTFLDYPSLLRAELSSPDVSTRLVSAQRLLQSSASTAQRQAALSVAKAIAEQLPALDDALVAKALRLQGEALVVLGRGPDAVAAYEKALALDPKIGIKKKLAALRKTLGLPA